MFDQLAPWCTYPGSRQSEQVDAISEDLAGSVISDSASKGEWVPHDVGVYVLCILYIYDAARVYMYILIAAKSITQAEEKKRRTLVWGGGNK